MAQTSPLDPAMPPRENLESLALDLARAASGLTAAVPELTRQAVRDLIRIADAHYSLSIDGHRVHPVHIEQAARPELSDDAAVRALQREAVAYLRAGRFLETRLTEEPTLDLPAAGFLKVLHWELYSRIPEEFRWVRDPSVPDRKNRVIPGELRTLASMTGGRPSIDAASVEPVLSRFHAAYDLQRLSPVERIIAVGASHHRLLWIHPFAAGNGRVARLLSAALAQRAGIEGALGGMWTISRGLSRNRSRYCELLAAADLRQRNDLDGRETLAPRALLEFTRFFLETCRQEIGFMRQALSPQKFGERAVQYVALRNASLAPGGPLHEEAASLLRDVMLRGEIARGEAGRVTGMATSEARKILSVLVKERFLVSDSPKGPVRLCIPAHAAPFLFPDLFPAEVALRAEPWSTIEAA